MDNGFYLQEDDTTGAKIPLFGVEEDFSVFADDLRRLADLTLGVLLLFDLKISIGKLQGCKSEIDRIQIRFSKTAGPDKTEY